MRSSYKQDDVVLLLKDITGAVKPQATAERERLIQSGRHYCEMLPIEYVPTEAYMHVYNEALHMYAAPTAAAAARLAGLILSERGSQTVLVSLARAGIPAGILVRRYLKKYGLADLPHYAISIIRGKGIDRNAMRYLLDRYAPRQLLFVDGWIGKGAILTELKKAAACYEGVSPELAVLADPANLTQLCGTHEDILIPSSCLNCTVSGLISRTFFRSDIIGADDFHGAVYYEGLRQQDLSYAYIDAIEAHFPKPWADALTPATQQPCTDTGVEEAMAIKEAFHISSLHLIKPGIGETTRVLLRRVPWKILVGTRWKDDLSLRPVLRLAEEKGVPVESYPLRHYKCCGIIRQLADI
ncbi:MAG: cysteine protease StiP family protein [Eubacterium sp.]|nr:cysteine protease StiP family protein [Eubacterium sp.]